MRDNARRARLKALEDSLRDKAELLVVMAIGREPAEVEAEVARLQALAPAGAPIIILDR
jgi:sirohydrochlorin ferrochelatase